MKVINIYGLLFIAIIMIPNIVFAIKCRDGFSNRKINKYLEAAEQIGRFGCFGFMIFNIPGTCFGWRSDEAFTVYLIANGLLTAAYCLIWIICFNKNSLFKSLALSVIPSVIFLLDGIMTRSVLLILSAVLFAPSHIMISYKNAKS